MKKLTVILLTVVMLFTCLSDTAIAVEYSSEAAGSGYVEVIYDIPIYGMYGYLNSNYAIAITLPNNFGGPQDVTDSIRWEAYYAGSKFRLKSGTPYNLLEEPEFNPNAKGGYVDEQLIFFGAFPHNYTGDGSWTTLPIQDQYGAVTTIRIKATFDIKGGIGNVSINNIDNKSYFQLVDAMTYEPVPGTTVYGSDWNATVKEYHAGNFYPVTGTTHSGVCNICGKTITEDCTFVDGYCEWCLQEERYAPVYWEPKNSELPNMSAANEAVLNVKLNKPIVGMAEYTLYAKASADVSDNWFSISAERIFVDTVSVDGTASELNFRVPAEYIYSGCGFVAFENILLYDTNIMADYMHVDRAKVGNEAGSSGRLSWRAAGDDKLYFDGLPTNYTKLGIQHNYSLNMGADVEAIQYSLTADKSGTYYRLDPANRTVNFGTPTADGTRIGFTSISITFDPSKKIVVQEKNKTCAKLDYTKGTISLYKSPGECIWKSSSAWLFDEVLFDTHIRAYDNRLYISPMNSTTLLEYNAEYYVVIDPGVITFEDGTSFEGIAKGRWSFKTLSEIEDHEHISDTWKSSKDSHWHICKICGRKYDTEGHKLDSNCRCTVCGATSHTESLDKRNVKAATCTEKGYTGESYCVICSATIQKGKDTPALGHNTHWVSDPNSSIHWEKCERCNAKISFENHRFENNKCVVCGASERYTSKEFTEFVWMLVNKHRPDLNSLPSPRTFHISNVNWCDQFVSQSASICGLNSIIYGSGSTGYGVKAIYDNIIKAGGTEIMNIGKGIYGEPQMGDIVIFDWPEYSASTGYYWSNTNVYQHIGIVVKVENGKIYTVHGNFHSSGGINGSYVCGPANSQLGVAACKASSSGFGQTWDIRYSKLTSTQKGGGRIYAYARPNWSKKADGIATNVMITVPGYINFAITYGDEILSSPQQRLMTLELNEGDEDYSNSNTSFGTYSIDENGNFVIVLDYHTDYGFAIYSATNDKIDIDIKYLDFYDNILNEVSFKNVEVTNTTTIGTSPFNEFGGYSLYLIDGENNVIGWSADADETATTPDAEFTEYLNYGEENQPDDEEPLQPTLPEHTHAFTSWQHDPAYHWLSCIGCGLTTDFAPHTFVNGVCSICGYVDSDFAADADQSDRIEIDLPTEGHIISEEEVNIEEIIE